MDYRVTIPDWIEGKPLHINVKGDNEEQARMNALRILDTIFTGYGQETPTNLLMHVATVVRVESK